MSTGNNEITEAELELAGTKNLQYLEAQTLQVLGIDLFKVLAYELIQLMNDRYLRQRLSNVEQT